jgi:hypothetical protein
VLRVEQGKGGKDRHAMLSPQLLELLRVLFTAAKLGAVHASVIVVAWGRARLAAGRLIDEEAIMKPSYLLLPNLTRSPKKKENHETVKYIYLVRPNPGRRVDRAIWMRWSQRRQSYHYFLLSGRRMQKLRYANRRRGESEAQ